MAGLAWLDLAVARLEGGLEYSWLEPTLERLASDLLGSSPVSGMRALA